MEVHNPTIKSFDDVAYLGVVITETRADQFHVGILYRRDDGATRMCHLAWHHTLNSDDLPTSNYAWLQSGLDDIDRKVARAVFAGINETKKLPIPYSVVYQGIYFEPGTLRFMRGEPGAGLTCATFIMAIFDSLGIPLLANDTWRERPTDQAWREYILELLGQDTRVSPEHIAAQRAHSRDPRFRPEEVAAAVATSDRPIDFDTAISLGAQIIGSMRRLDQQANGAHP